MHVILLCALLLQVPEHKVDTAVEKGSGYLRKAFSDRNRVANHPLSGKFDMDELVLYTLLHAGVDPKDGTVAALVGRLTSRDIERTYNAALCAMALEAYDSKSYQWRIAQCAQHLVDNQAANGQWSYGMKIKLPSNVPTGPPSGGSTPGSTKSLPSIKIRKGEAKGPATGDNSNSQYAALGLRAAAKAGITVPADVIALAAKWWEEGQRGDGSWGYNDEGMTGDAGYGAMTAGGAASLIILKDLEKKDGSKGNAPVKKALDWMGANLDYTRNPSYHNAWMWQFYWIYAVERAADLAGVDKVGSHAWYPEGAQYLIDNQKADGSWNGLSSDGKESVGGVIADTCFAILFLRRATKAKPRVATGTGK